MPAAQGRGGVWVNMCGIGAGLIAGFPDHALQGFKWCDLAIFPNPLLQDAVGIVGGCDFFARIRGHCADLFLYGRLIPMLAQEICHVRGGVGEQYLFDKGDAAGGAFYIGTLTGAATPTYEVLGFATCFTATLLFYLFATYASEEVNEALPFAILLIVGGTLMGLLLGFLGGKAPFTLSPTSGGEAQKHTAPVDTTAILLCLLRILTC